MQTKRKLRRCSGCGAQLSRALIIRSGKDPSVPPPEHVDRAPLTEPGTAFKSYEPIERSFSERPALLEFVPQYWLNLVDLTESVKRTHSQDRLGGCCGIAGTSGPNQQCGCCGRDIDTLRDDCMWPLVFIPEPDETRWEDICLD